MNNLAPGQPKCPQAGAHCAFHTCPECGEIGRLVAQEQRLNEAAPALLTALKELVAAFYPTDGGDRKAWAMVEAEKAIAKAESE